MRACSRLRTRIVGQREKVIAMAHHNIIPFCLKAYREETRDANTSLEITLNENIIFYHLRLDESKCAFSVGNFSSGSKNETAKPMR
jgi:hypothetical protein